LAVYIIAGLLVVAVLWAAYRAFGGTAANSPDDATLLRGAAKMAATLAGDDVGDRGRPRTVRRTLDGVMQALDRVDVAALGDGDAAAHALLHSAVEDLSWAERLRETATFATNLGLQDAVAALNSHAGRCLDEVARLLGSGAPKEVDSPA